MYGLLRLSYALIANYMYMPKCQMSSGPYAEVDPGAPVAWAPPKMRPQHQNSTKLRPRMAVLGP